jgi:hypothetical protein
MPTSLPSTKRRKTSKNSQVASSIQDLESRLTEAVSSNTTLNPLIDLVKLTEEAVEAEDVSKGLYAIYRVFVVILGSKKYGLGGQEREEGKLVRAWIWERLNCYVDYLLGLLKDEEKSLRVRLSHFLSLILSNGLRAGVRFANIALLRKISVYAVQFIELPAAISRVAFQENRFSAFTLSTIEEGDRSWGHGR